MINGNICNGTLKLKNVIKSKYCSYLHRRIPSNYNK